MTDSFLPITAHINGRAVPRDEVLAWEATRSAKVARRLAVHNGGGSLPELNRRIMQRKLELGHDAIERMLRRDLRVSGAGGLFGAAVGALNIFLLQSLLTFFNVSTFVLQVAYGAILVAAVSVSPLQERLARSPR